MRAGASAGPVGVWIALVCAGSFGAACVQNDVVATRIDAGADLGPGTDAGEPTDVGTDAIEDATVLDAQPSDDTGTDAASDAGLDPVTNCPASVTLPGGTCSGALAAATFGHAVCVCVLELTVPTEFRVDAFDSRVSSYDPLAPNPGGFVGSNTLVSLGGTVDLRGSMTVVSPAGMGLGPNAVVDIDGRLVVYAPLADASRTARVSVGSDVSVGGALVLGRLDVGGVLRQTPGEVRMVDTLFTGGGDIRETVFPARPCDCQSLNVTSLVAAAATGNENAAVGLVPTELAAVTTDQTRALPCGRYYLQRLGGTARITLRATGSAAVFVAGDVDVANLTLVADPGATLDLFVAGALVPGPAWSIGDPARPAAVRVYVQGGAALAWPSTARLAAELYAPNAAFAPTGALEVYGSVLARSVSSPGSLRVHADLSVGSANLACAR